MIRATAAATAAFAVALALAAASPAVADPQVDAPAEDRIGARVDDGAGGGAGAPLPAGGTPTRRRRPTAPARPRPPMVVVPVVRVVDGRPCLAAARRPGDPSALRTVIDEAELLSLRRRVGRCPAPVRRPALPPAASAAEPVVRRWAAETALPAPALVVRPGVAIVGKSAYLEIAGDRRRQWQVEALGWSITVDATAVYTVDWGDGTVVAGVTSQGGPWPDGDLHHTYLVAGPWLIAVTEHWTANWTATGHGETHSGVIEGALRTYAELLLPAVDLQAVRRR